MKDFMDLHTHTLASGHAYNTINEMIQAAAERKLELFAITEHGPAMHGSCNQLYFTNFRVLPRERNHVNVLYGVELNILDFQGRVDLSNHLLAEMDLTIASIHSPCFTAGTKEENTRAYLNVMKNPLINIIGHPDDSRFPIDYKALVEGAKEHQVLLEVNNSSLSPNSYRGNAKENYYEMLEYCKEYQVPVLIDSDAHVDLDVGNHQLAWALMEEVNMPKHLIINTQKEEIKKYLNYFKR